jgi:hypothetical protein
MFKKLKYINSKKIIFIFGFLICVFKVVFGLIEWDEIEYERMK